MTLMEALTIIRNHYFYSSTMTPDQYHRTIDAVVKSYGG